LGSSTSSDPHSFPTRRSSDLRNRASEDKSIACESSALPGTSVGLRPAAYQMRVRLRNRQDGTFEFRNNSGLPHRLRIVCWASDERPIYGRSSRIRTGGHNEV